MAAPTEASEAPRPTCFIAMPLSVRDAEYDRYGDKDHWLHVMDSLFVNSIEKAGYRAIRPVTQGSHLIHGEIIRQLIQADLVLCDLSSHNPNVFFELGVRTSLNLPVALVRDEFTELPFDTSVVNTQGYRSTLRAWDIEEEREKLSAHILTSVASCKGANPLWRQFGLSIRAQEPELRESPLEAKVDIIAATLTALQNKLPAQPQVEPRRSAQRVALDHLADTERPAAERTHRRRLIDDVTATPKQDGVDVRRFLTAAREYASNEGLSALHVSASNGRHISLSVEREWSESHLARIALIADRCNVELTVSNNPAAQAQPQATLL